VIKNSFGSRFFIHEFLDKLEIIKAIATLFFYCQVIEIVVLVLYLHICFEGTCCFERNDKMEGISAECLRDCAGKLAWIREK